MSGGNALSVMGYDVLVDQLEDAVSISGSKKIINTINPHSYITAKSNPSFRKALLSSDMLLADGSGVVLAARQISGDSITKMAGADLHQHLLAKLNESGGRCFYLGAAPATLDKIKARLAEEFPNVQVDAYSPPYKPEFSEEDSAVMIEAVNAFAPDVLFVGMTAPKQERWLDQHKNELDYKVASCIGAVFDFYAGTVQRPSDFWIKMHLEWLPRLLKEPRRLWRRNFVSTPLFLLDVLLYKLGVKS
ncbi:MAG: WecB/TagA/CpsF family glycosyltransferase [Pseudomonadales bacterium]|nr:WecB/TagA/CpsF family glycosyltransferase [Pseudomonadales bacterium]